MLPESVRERVVKEQNELRDKITKLALFVYSAKIETVDEKQARLLKAQLRVMEEYNDILTERLEANLKKQVPNTKDVTVKMSVKCGNKQA